MSKVYFITRSYPPFEKGGGSLMRYAFVQTLIDHGLSVKVIRIGPTVNDFGLRGKSILQVLNIIYVRALLLFERLGVIRDYLLPYSISWYLELRKKVGRNDIIISTTGGELGTVILGDMLRNKTGAIHVIHLRDPINYGVNLGVKKNNKFHVGRAHVQIMLMKNADLLVFTAERHAEKIARLELGVEQLVQYSGYISNKYRYGFDKLILEDKDNNQIVDVYEKIQAIKSKYPNAIICFYGGSASSVVQGVNNLLTIIGLFPPEKIQVFVFSDLTENNKLDFENINYESVVAAQIYVKLFSKYADIGLVSLIGPYVAHCLPAKIFDIVEHGKYILGYAMKDSEISIAVNKYGKGSVVYQDLDMDGQKYIVSSMIENFDKNRELNIQNTSNKWSMSIANSKLITYLKLKDIVV